MIFPEVSHFPMLFVPTFFPALFWDLPAATFRVFALDPATRDGLGDLLRRRQALLRTTQRLQGIAGVATSCEATVHSGNIINNFWC